MALSGTMSALLLQFVLCSFVLLATSQNLNFVRTYGSGWTIPGGGDTELENWFRQLPTSGTQSITVSSSVPAATFMCNVPALAQQIVNNVKNTGGATVNCNGVNWHTGGCCGLSIEINGGNCQCAQAFAIRTGPNCGRNFGGVTCPPAAPTTLSVNVNACGDGTARPPEQCDGGTFCSNCICQTGYQSTNPLTRSCQLIDNCAVYGFSNRRENAISCTNGVNQRTITCSPGYFVVGSSFGQQSITLTGNAQFSGCQQINMCQWLGFSNRVANTFSCTNGVNQRTITCNAGFWASPTRSSSITLDGTAEFMGCSLIDTCATYGTSNSPNVNRCVSGVNTRTIFCNPGYAIAGTADTNFQVLPGAAEFRNPGCLDIDECGVYGYNQYGTNAQSCSNSAVNQRTITCKPGFFVEGGQQGTPSITLTGKAGFAGCSLENQCTLYGYSGRNAFTRDCNAGTNQRTIQCLPGYAAAGGQTSTSESVTLTGAAAFGGCTEINECEVYGFSGKPGNTATCVNGINARTITCAAGYFISGGVASPPEVTRTFTGSAAFPGCVQIDNCAVYGYSSKPQNVADNGCTNFVNRRVITCKLGFFAVGGVSWQPTISLTGNTAFAGCGDVNECLLYGYSGKGNNTFSCSQPAPNQRQITCSPGYRAIAPANPTIILNGNTSFDGCTLIDNCVVYGASQKLNGYANCTNGVNRRTLTCKAGFTASPDVNATITTTTLVGNAVFGGCFDIKECTVYAFSGRRNNVLSCTEPEINKRNITCRVGYRVDIDHSLFINGSDPDESPERPEKANTPWIVLRGRSIFPGCVEYCGDGLITGKEECDDGNDRYGDGCSSACHVEEGYNCSKVWGGKACCYHLEDGLRDYIDFTTLRCYDGWWVQSNTSALVVDFEPEGEEEEAESKKRDDLPTMPTIELTESANFCGHIIIGHDDEELSMDSEELSDRIAHVRINDITLSIAGTLTILSSGVVSIVNDTGRIALYEPCDFWKGDWDPNQNLHMTGYGQISLENLEWEDAEDAPGPFITVENCVTLDGAFYIQSSEIPSGSTDMPFLTANGTECTTDYEADAFHDTDHLISGACSYIEPFWSDEQDTLNIEINKKDLCTGQIVGIVFGVVGSIVLLAILAFLMMGSGGGGEDVYTAF